MVATIAIDQGLQPVVADRFEGVSYANIAQRDESDIHLLTHIGREHVALVAVKHGRLIFTTLGEGLSASGTALPVAVIRPTRSYKPHHAAHRAREVRSRAGHMV